MCYIYLNKSSDLQHSTVDYDLPGVRVYGVGEGAAAAAPVPLFQQILIMFWLVTARKHLHHS